MQATRFVRSFVATSALTFFAVGCKLLNKGDDAAEAGSDASAPVAVVEDAAPAPAPAAPVAAANAGQVGRFKDETAMNEPATTASAGSAQVAPGTSREVAFLKAGTAVTKIAQRREDALKTDYFLVTFTDPKNPAQVLMGWISANAFKASAVVVPTGDAGRDAAPAPGPVDASAKG
jgi:hypothetical protein